MGIRTKLIVFLLALLTAVSAVMAVLFFRGEWGSILSNNQQKNLRILLAMSEVCREIRNSQRTPAAYEYFKKFLRTPEIIKVACSEAGGKVFMEDRYYSPTPPPFRYLFTHFSPPAAGVWETSTDNGVEILKASFTSKSAKGRRITAHVDFSTQLMYQEMDASLRQSTANFFIILSIAFAIGCTGTLIITRVVVRPMRTMAEAARMIGSGRLDHRIPVESGDEMGMLASEFNEMAGRLKEFDEMKRDFVSSITHDLRSPVTGIELCTDMIRELAGKGDCGRIAEQAFSIKEHSQRLNLFIDSLLEVSKIESGGMKLDIKPVNLEELADRAVRSFKPYAAQKGLKLELVVGQETPDIRGDAERLYRALANVIGNAVKFTSAGSVSVFVEAEPGRQKVRVRDTGIGIPAGELKNVFSKFYRLNPRGRDYPSARQGTGLGLFIAKSIVEQHGGTISAESGLGKGSVFTISLPAQEAA